MLRKSNNSVKNLGDAFYTAVIRTAGAVAVVAPILGSIASICTGDEKYFRGSLVTSAATAVTTGYVGIYRSSERREDII